MGQAESNVMPTDAFARRVAKETVKDKPTRYLTLGVGSTLFKVFSWFPRTAILALLWRLVLMV